MQSCSGQPVKMFLVEHWPTVELFVAFAKLYVYDTRDQSVLYVTCQVTLHLCRYSKWMEAQVYSKQQVSSMKTSDKHFATNTSFLENFGKV